MVFICQAARRRLSMMAYNGALTLASVHGYLPASDVCMCDVNGRAAPFAGSRKGDDL